MLACLVFAAFCAYASAEEGRDERKYPTVRKMEVGSGVGACILALPKWLCGMSHAATLELRYSPKGGCADKLVEIIDAARSTIRAMVYGATLEEVSDALLRAGKDVEKGGRDVDVRVILDKRQTKRDQAKFYDKLERARGDGKIEVRLYTPGGWSCMHHKVGIFDGKVVTTGSFNWTKNAQDNNNENLVAIESRDLAEAYTRIFDELWKVASPEGSYRSIRRFGRFVLSFLPVSGRYFPANQ